MTKAVEPLSSHQLSARIEIILEMFVRTADEDYVTARWAMSNRMMSTFCWLSAHCLEKYFKAVLLMNGRSARTQGHDVVRLYNEVRDLAGELLSDRMPRPDWVEEKYWHDQTIEQFIERLAEFGNADNRYLVFGYMYFEQDLFFLDHMVRFTRRLLGRLDEPIIPDEPGLPTLREALRSPAYHPIHGGMLLEQLARDTNRNTEASRALLNRNFAFAPADYPHAGAVGGSGSSGSAIVREILEPMRSANREWALDGVEIADWLLSNIRLSRGAERQIRDAVKEARRRFETNDNSRPSMPD